MAKKVTPKKPDAHAAKVKAIAAWRKQPLVPGSSVTNAQAASGRNAAVASQYGAQEAALGQSQRNVEAWFPKYQQELTAINNAQQARYAQAQAQIAAQSAAAQQQQSASNQQLAGQLQKDAASRGATYSGQASQDSQQATNNQQNLATALAAAIGAQGAAYSGFTAGQQDQGAAAKLAARQKFSADRVALKGQEGAAATNYMATARDNEQKNLLEQAAFGLKSKTEADSRKLKLKSLKVSKQNNAANNATSVQNTNKRVAASQQAAAQRAAQHTADQQAAKQAKQQAAQQKARQQARAQSRTAGGRLHDIIGRWNTYATMPVTDNKTKKQRPPTPTEIKGRILGESGKGGKFTAPELHLALMLRINKRFTPADMRLARELGYQVPKDLRPVKMPADNAAGNQRYQTSKT